MRSAGAWRIVLVNLKTAVDEAFDRQAGGRTVPLAYARGSVKSVRYRAVTVRER